MKKILSFLMIICLLWTAMPVLTAEASETAAQSDTTAETELVPVILPTDDVSTEDIILYSSACCVMDADTGEILYYKNMDDRHYPASITKVLTGLLLIENADLDEMITFSDDCWEGLNYYNDMNIGILDGEQLSVEAALHAILLSSANEVCNGAAEYVSGSIEAFCAQMNERAAALGCTNTHFVNPNGLHDENHYTSARDMALIARAAIQNPTFRKITGSYDYTVASTNLRPEGFPLSHKHKMLMYTEYHYNACIGGKTGYTEEASNTLVTYAEKNGMTLVCVVMENSDGHIYPDTIEALDYCFDHYEKTAVDTDDFSSGDINSQWPSLPFEGFDIQTFQCVSDGSGSIVTDSTTDFSDLSRSLILPDSIDSIAPYRTALYPFGTVRYTLEDTQTVGQLPLYASLSSVTRNQLSLDPELTDGRADGEDVPTFVQLRETGDSSREASGLLEKLTSAVLNHLPLAVASAVIVFCLLTFILIWLRGILTRRRHRRNYERLRKQRIDKNSKN